MCSVAISLPLKNWFCFGRPHDLKRNGDQLKAPLRVVSNVDAEDWLTTKSLEDR